MLRYRVVLAALLFAASMAPLDAWATDRAQPIGEDPVMATPIEIPKIHPVNPVAATPIEIPKIAPVLATPIEIPGDDTRRVTPACDPNDPNCEDGQQD